MATDASAWDRAEELSRTYRAAEQARAYRGGLLIFLVSESMFFVAVLASRFVLAGTGHPAELNQILVGVLSAVMLASLVPVARMRRAAARGSWAKVQREATLALLAGVVLLAGVGWEWGGLSLAPASRYGGIYYLSVGLDALHVFIGVLLLAGVAGRARHDRFTPEAHFGVVAGQMFWYLVTAVWLAVWIVFYLL